MGVITSVRRNVKNAGRCSVFVDDVFFAACPIDVALSLGLRKGLEMSAELERRLRAEDRRMVLRQKSYRYATYKPRTERDVRRFLDKAEATSEETADVLRWLEEFRLINDAEYARRFIEASKLRKPLSPVMMRRTLLGKGLSESTVESAMMTETSAEDALEAARSVSRKKLRMITSIDARSTEDKLVRFLQYRGYTWDVIKRIVADWKDGALAVAIVVLATCVTASAQLDTSCGKVRMSDVINKFQPSTLPVPGTEGELYIDRKFHPDNPDGGSADPDQVWVTRQRRGQWEAPSLASIDVVDLKTGRRITADVVFGFSADTMRALLAGRFIQGSAATALVLAHRTSASGPFVSFQVIMPDLGKNFYATCSDDGSVFIVAIDRPGGRGDLDLYRITQDACGNLSGPVPLADNLNTAAFDGAPWLCCDGRTLYFASAGREDRRGKADLYVTRRLDDSWNRWSDPVNLGSCINSTEDETAVSTACQSSTLYFTSWDSASERMGIYSADVPEPMQARPVIKTCFTVRDAITDSALRGLHILQGAPPVDSCGPSRGWPLDGRTGIATMMLPPGSTVPISIASNPHWMLIEGRSDTTDRLVNVILSVLPLGRPLCSIMFDKADATISATATDALESLRKKLGTGSVPRLRIIGYADGSGTDLANDRLSLARARAVAEQATILVPAGDLRHITFEGRGVERVEGRGAVHDAPQSRRVDVYVAP